MSEFILSQEEIQKLFDWIYDLKTMRGRAKEINQIFAKWNRAKREQNT